MKSISLPEEFDYDVWVTKFVYELHDFFGMPSNPQECSSKSAKMQFLWARMGISNAMSKSESTWRAMRGKVDPKIAAEEFVRRYYNEYDKLVIGDVPDFFINPNRLKGATKSLPSPNGEKIEAGKKN